MANLPGHHYIWSSPSTATASSRRPGHSRIHSAMANPGDDRFWPTCLVATASSRRPRPPPHLAASPGHNRVTHPAIATTASKRYAQPAS